MTDDDLEKGQRLVNAFCGLLAAKLRFLENLERQFGELANEHARAESLWDDKTTRAAAAVLVAREEVSKAGKEAL